MKLFKLKSDYKPSGDQPKAIKKLLESRPSKSLLLGVTGSGKTFTLANVIAGQNKPVLILAPNKTLAAQLFEEFSSFFPENKVCYFVSYYDHYRPESYLPAQDIYIPKETRVNSELDRLRIESTASLINRDDTIVIASVSSIYGLGNPTDYKELALSLKVGQEISKEDLIAKLKFLQYIRNDVSREAGTFYVFNNILEVILPYQKEKLYIELEDNKVKHLHWSDKQTDKMLMEIDNTVIFPSKHFVATEDAKQRAIKSIEAELENHVRTIPNPMYRERIKARVNHDLEMIKDTGYCSGIENYSVHFDGRITGQAPYSLFDFFHKDFLLIIDESHITVPQLRGMYAGDRARKKSLIDFGFRLPSALDNRPLKFEETEKYFNDVIFVSATPAQYEIDNSSKIVEQIIRPTGLVDPVVEVYNRENQLNHLIGEIEKTRAKGYRTLVTVLTKKMAEEMARYLEERQIKVCYLHSTIKTPQRTELLHKLRAGVFDCLVGVNLLREGLDLPEVALVAIMDADIESFLRDKKSLIQTIGRAARNTESKVIFYGDKITKSMKEAMDETYRRRVLQISHNEKHNIIPATVVRDVTKSISKVQKAIIAASKKVGQKKTVVLPEDLESLNVQIKKLEEKMLVAAKKEEFDKAIALREEWTELKNRVNNKIANPI